MRDIYYCEDGKIKDIFTWVYTEKENGERVYLAGTSGRIRITDAGSLCNAMNEYCLCVGDCK